MNLHFGIPSLDSLLDTTYPNFETADAKKANPAKDDSATSMAILGPDGTGKSVLALHLASRYHFDAMCRRKDDSPSVDRPLVMYVSSDLRHEKARKVWENFGLHRPADRQIPFERTRAAVERYNSGKSLLATLKASLLREYPATGETPEFSPHPNLLPDLYLRELLPTTSSQDLKHEYSAVTDEAGDAWKDLLDFWNVRRKHPHVAFLDLATNTAGDDWSFVNALLGKLSEEKCPVDQDGNDIPHLLIIDSVAGFETFVGRLDAFGMEQTRRSRIAQCMRNAGPKCHLVFVVEEELELNRLPEEYVTDVVIRLRRQARGGTIFRTVEVEKARAQTAAMGEHPFEVYSHNGTSTGSLENADQPGCNNDYVQVFHSLYHRNQLVAADVGYRSAQADRDVVSFGIPNLDHLLAVGERKGGLQHGTVTALLGDSSTGKSLLSQQFLAQSFIEQISLAKRFVEFVTQDPAIESDHQWINTLGKRLSAPLLMDSDSQPPSSEFSLDRTKPLFAQMKAYWSKCLDHSIEQSESLYLKLRPEAKDLCRAERWKIFNELLVPLHQPHDRKSKLALLYSKRDWLDPASPNGVFFNSGNSLVENSTTEAEVRQQKKELVQWFLKLLSLPQLLEPAVLVTTSDRTSEGVAHSIVNAISAQEGMEAFVQEHHELFVEHLEYQLIVRRFNIGEMSAPTIFHLIHRQVILAQQMIYQVWMPPTQRIRYCRAGGIRVVVDDMRSLRAMSPDVANDGAFLPFLTFCLEREGVTSLLVYSDSVRPDRQPEDSVTRLLQTLLHRTILLWPVQLEGRARIALTVIPTGNRHYNGTVRELFIQSRSVKNPEKPGTVLSVDQVLVTRRFELYRGFEEGRPSRVPLAVYLFEETPAFQKYVSQEQVLFRELFEPLVANQNEVVIGVKGERLGALRELCQLPIDTKSDHAIVFQVDSYWGLGQNAALCDQTAYLQLPFSSDKTERAQQDPFGLFSTKKPVSGPLSSRRLDHFSNPGYRNRIDQYNDRSLQEGLALRRVPYMWDFSFLLLPPGPWETASESPVKYFSFDQAHTTLLDSVTDSGSDYFAGKPLLVKDVLKRLGDSTAGISWREFFGACRKVALSAEQQSGRRVSRFDLAVPWSDTFLCFILEVWLSEIVKELESEEGSAWESNRPKTSTRREWTFAGNLKAVSIPNENSSISGDDALCRLVDFLTPKGKSLREDASEFLKKSKDEDWDKLSRSKRIDKWSNQMNLGWLSFYKAWLLLIEVLDFESLVDPAEPFDIAVRRDPSPMSVATRHWYKTACQYSTDLLQGNSVTPSPFAVAMPGTFSSRGDWFLAAPQSTRSELLSQNAMDLLNSRRANHTRMQLGLGLPVRDIMDERFSESTQTESFATQLRTALRAQPVRLGGPEENRPDEGLLEHLTYGKLLELQPRRPSTILTPEASEGEGSRDSVRWLFRESIQDYDRLSRPFRRWLARLVSFTVQYQRRYGKDQWDGGFIPYDLLSEKYLVNIREYKSFVEFAKLCDLLREELVSSSRSN